MEENANISIPSVADSTPGKAELRPRPATSRRRDKPQLSCDSCRRRKGRCDRRAPCSSCVTRGHVCTYPNNHVLSAPSSGAPLIQDRLEQLERLVVSLMQGSTTKERAVSPAGGNIAPISSSDSSAIEEVEKDRRPDCGSMRVSDSELRYVGGDHWASILDSVADLKVHFDREERLRLEATSGSFEEDTNRGSTSRALLLYGCRHATSREDILASLPSRSVVDRYVSGYFNRLDLVSSSAVHGPTFLRQYEAFWATPLDVPIMWIGLLFSMMCLAVQASTVSDTATSHETDQHRRQIELYHEKVVQCLLMGEYTKSGPHALETLIHYVYIEFCLHPDADRDIWFLLSLEVNLAMRMGYHRDPSHFPGITPLQGEMRRRMWATVLLGDVLISSQMGMPRMISDWQCDTAEPRNLNDSDLDADALELPPSRPESENTTALCLIARRRMVIALGKASDLAAAVKPCSYAEVMHVDGVLHEAANSIPQQLKIKSMTASLTDSPRIIMERLFISHMFYKGQLMLHRRFLFQDSTSPDTDTLAHSRKACIDASLGLLGIQKILDEETGADGQLHTMHWRITSILNHQFLTATMILCSILHHGQMPQHDDKIRAALQQAQGIWMRRSPRSQEARTAADMVNLVLSGTTGASKDNFEALLEQEIPQRYITGLFDQSALSSQAYSLQSLNGRDEGFPYFPYTIPSLYEESSNDWMPENWSG
ncbi:hypothetical protein P170DRAFT_387278 [Aspergillus steynii IBT 23096]|uniref:Zn(2)-C6 fungal-type domain-containing protein n=1 Tax=Aspergillus steynii IBT 23096 TaxID=1392250 RepID=A0A2I2G0L4_9EURO|nr:uncharacterized protein P170DRAFT_387278 [Aspergillus steynii IBT 23096]PLB46424.1 hypothetical protein P170DRAFT_387278 [Aspergillus steynii IBT 23096]